MLHSGHPSGSLRGDPIIVSDDGAIPVGGRRAPPRYLILSMADGLDAMRLRAYRLPIEGVADVPPLQPEPRVRGWSWFQPSCDGEKVVLTTDAGVLGLYGINQYQNQDQPLFPMFPREIELEGNPKNVGRAQVVHIADQDYWALAQGNLQQWRMGLGPDGLKAAAVWLQPLPLGSPLHAAQVSLNGDTLFTVTQSPARQACLATAVEAATGLGALAKATRPDRSRRTAIPGRPGHRPRPGRGPVRLRSGKRQSGNPPAARGITGCRHPPASRPG